MRTRLMLALLASFLAGACSTTGGSRSNEAIEIAETGNVYRLSVPVSELTMTLPRSGWFRKDKSALGGGTANPRYFYFVDEKEESLILSGWFEPERLFSGSAAKQWEKDAAALKKTAVPEPVNVSFEKMGAWDIVMYDHLIGKAVSSHMRAHWVQAGTWIELHLSTTTQRPSAENRRKLRAVLRGIAVKEKAGSVRTAAATL
ncbi:MAG: hypothetical protein ABR570_16080 [Burkholderiales bacterium]